MSKGLIVGLVFGIFALAVLGYLIYLKLKDKKYKKLYFYMFSFIVMSKNGIIAKDIHLATYIERIYTGSQLSKVALSIKTAFKLELDQRVIIENIKLLHSKWGWVSKNPT